MTQKQALETMLLGHNIFLTGPPGSGKTYLLKEFLKLAQQKQLKVAVTATTGIAATHLDGVTIHSWAGLGLADRLNDKSKIKLLKNFNLVERYNSTDILVIDEISMLDAKRLDILNELAKSFRASSKVMGGLQTILVGDLFQLPPVGKVEKSYVFQSNTWEELKLCICYLTEQHRQQPGDELNSILSAIRHNRLGEVEMSILKSKLLVNQPIKSNILRLYSHNIDVDKLNNQRLKLINHREHIFKMSIKGDRSMATNLKKTILSPPTLKLKKGCEVIFTANDYRLGYVNGDRGRVVGFKSGYPIIRMYRGAYTLVNQHTWRSLVNGQSAEVYQLPLKLAWAMTIHKSQGMSLDEAVIDLSRAFSAGMGYVALSRLRNIDGLYLLGLNKMSLYVDNKVLKFDKTLRLASDKLVIR